MFKKNTKESLTDLSTQEINTLIGEGFHIIGNINGSSAIRIDGKVSGNVEVKSGIILGEKGTIEGDLISDSAIVYGTITGNIRAGRLDLKASSDVQGDIRAETLEMETGAHFNGRLDMKGQHQNAKDEKARSNSLKEVEKSLSEIMDSGNNKKK